MPTQPESKRSPIRGSIIVLTLLLSVQIAASLVLRVHEEPLGTPQLNQIPSLISNWRSVDEQTLEPDVTAALKPDDYILRTYQNQGRAGSLTLFVAYFKSLQNSYGPHSPRVCLPGSGWLTHSWKVVEMPVPGKPEGIPVNQYVLEKDSQRILVVYWYQNDRRAWAEEYQVKLHLLPDLVRYRRSDVSLVRIVTSIPQDNSLDQPWNTSTEFARALFPSLAERLSRSEQHP